MSVTCDDLMPFGLYSPDASAGLSLLNLEGSGNGRGGESSGDEECSGSHCEGCEPGIF